MCLFVFADSNALTMRISIMNVRNKARIMLFGLLLIIVIDAILCLVLADLIKRSLVINTACNTVLFLLGGIWVGWKIKTPSWGDSVVFGMVCIIILNLLPVLILHRPCTAWSIVVLAGGFAGAFSGVLFSGYLARKIQRKKPVSDGEIAP